MECGPENCPLTAWAALSPSERKVQRQPLARKLYEQGFTPEAISKHFGVGIATTYRDLEFYHDDKTPPRASKRGRAGEGRPRGTPMKAKKFEEARKLVRSRVIAGQPLKTRELEKEHGISVDTLERAAAAERVAKEACEEKMALDPAYLNKTSQEKLDIAIRHHTRKLDIEYEQRVRDDVTRRIDEIVLPHWKEQIEQAQELYKHRRGAMDKTTFTTIIRALHADSRLSISDERLNEAFNAFMGLEKFLLNEKDSPTSFKYPDGSELPSSLAEWDKMRRKPMKRSNGSSIRPR